MRGGGPVVVMSRELPADELGARAIGMQCEASWVDVLKGKVSVDEMRRRADLPLVFIADRRNATLVVLEAMIKAAQDKAPGKLVLVVVDYLQIVESKEGDPRSKVADVVAQIDELVSGDRACGNRDALHRSERTTAGGWYVRSGSLHRQAPDGRRRQGDPASYNGRTGRWRITGPACQRGARRADRREVIGSPPGGTPLRSGRAPVGPVQLRSGGPISSG